MGFKKGYDPNRHQLTQRERKRGYANAVKRIEEGDGSPELLAWMFRKLRKIRKTCQKNARTLPKKRKAG